jgi:hypothetical protein
MKEHKQSKIGFLTVFVGPTGSGKTCLANELFEDAEYGCVLDIQEEYEDLEGLHVLIKENRSAKKFSMHPAYFEVEDFVNIVKISKNATFLLEESTGYVDVDFFRSKLGGKLIKEIVAKRQIQREVGGGNNFIFIFHSLNSIPPKLWNYIDFLVMFESIEREIKASEPAILAAQSELVNSHKIPFKNFKISDYRVIVRTNHGRDNLEYIEKFKSKIYETK